MKTEIAQFIITIIGFACMWNSIVLFRYWDWFVRKLDRWSGCDNTTFRFHTFNFLAELFGCPNCLTFWSILIYTFNPLYAGIGFVISKIIEDYINGRK